MFCSKPSCRIKIQDTELNDDYFATIILFGEDGEIYSVRAFKTSIKEFEGKGNNDEEKLAILIGKTVEIEASKNDDPEKESMLKKLTIIN